MEDNKNPISAFMQKHFLHFNAATVVDAAQAYCHEIKQGRKMLISLAGAMSTAEIGVSLAEMIRRDKVHIISCTGANLEEDVMNLVAHKQYKRIPDYRTLNKEQEEKLYQKGYNRVTDTCIPEQEAFRKLESKIYQLWMQYSKQQKRAFPHHFFYELLLSGVLESDYQIDPQNSWVLAAAQKKLPLVVPGWEDSTLGNIFASYCIKKAFSSTMVKGGIEYMVDLSNWYKKESADEGIGFFQIGGGIAGDFPICVVPMMYQDLGWKETPFWSYFCQISDATTSYGSYSGAVPGEKISWGKIKPNTPAYVIESDASIVAPLVFAYVLGW